jgi:hypothetical protein
VQDVMGEYMALEGFCSQNTLKNKRLEHQSYKQEKPGMGILYTHTHICKYIHTYIHI